MHITIIILLLMILLPSTAYANGGGPLLLLLNAGVFTIGQIWIIGAETFVYKQKANLSTKDSIIQVVGVNVISTIVIGLGFPLVLAIIGGIGSFLPEPIGPSFLLIGTWVFDKVPYKIELLPYAMGIGFIVTYFLTVYFEAWCLQKYWKRKEIKPPITAKGLSWYANTYSYAGLMIISGAYYLTTKI